MKRSFVYSLALHLSPLLLLISLHGTSSTNEQKDQDKQEEQGSQTEKNKASIVEKNDVVEVELVDVPAEGLLPTEPVNKFVDRDCHGKDWFGGIGVTLSGVSESGRISLIRTAHKGYPAEKAGIRAGDWILNNNEIRGEPGTDVKVVIDRGRVRLNMTITREKICTEPVDGLPQP